MSEEWVMVPGLATTACMSTAVCAYFTDNVPNCLIDRKLYSPSHFGPIERSQLLHYLPSHHLFHFATTSHHIKHKPAGIISHVICCTAVRVWGLVTLHLL
mmetsp:Transcript_119310/g.207680  ORF Transcript_119310/g.207680 Transcript_119310/m.207680 type:complete len:100 (-) Transcript_119310:222-521(-)